MRASVRRCAICGDGEQCVVHKYTNRSKREKGKILLLIIWLVELFVRHSGINFSPLYGWLRLKRFQFRCATRYNSRRVCQIEKMLLFVRSPFPLSSATGPKSLVLPLSTEPTVPHSTATLHCFFYCCLLALYDLTIRLHASKPSYSICPPLTIPLAFSGSDQPCCSALHNTEGSVLLYPTVIQWQYLSALV